jgi:hypothetical protein
VFSSWSNRHAEVVKGEITFVKSNIAPPLNVLSPEVKSEKFVQDDRDCPLQWMGTGRLFMDADAPGS